MTIGDGTLSLKRVVRVSAVFILLIAILSIAASGTGICENPPVQPCLIVSHSLVCSSYTYQLLSSSGTIILNGNLTLWNQSQYSFLLENLSSGTFMIRLCDNSTREVTTVASYSYIGSAPLSLSGAIDLNTSSGIAVMAFLLIIWIVMLILGLSFRSPWLTALTSIYTIGLAVIVAYTMSLLAAAIIGFLGIGLLMTAIWFMKN